MGMSKLDFGDGTHIWTRWHNTPLWNEALDIKRRSKKTLVLSDDLTTVYYCRSIEKHDNTRNWIGISSYETSDGSNVAWRAWKQGNDVDGCSVTFVDPFIYMITFEPHDKDLWIFKLNKDDLDRDDIRKNIEYSDNGFGNMFMWGTDVALIIYEANAVSPESGMQVVLAPIEFHDWETLDSSSDSLFCGFYEVTTVSTQGHYFYLDIST